MSIIVLCDSCESSHAEVHTTFDCDETHQTYHLCLPCQMDCVIRTFMLGSRDIPLETQPELITIIVELPKARLISEITRSKRLWRSEDSQRPQSGYTASDI